MASLSLCMIVKNEEQNLGNCLKSCAKLFDEIIIVDTGSTDKTKQIAFNFTTKVYDFPWQQNFSLARNFAFKKATSAYCMWLDADDIIPSNSLKKLLALKNKLKADVYMLKYNIAFLNNKPTFSYFRERIIKNCQKAVWQGVVHECIVPFGNVVKLDIAINHNKKTTKNSNRNYLIYKQLLKTRQLTPREQYYFARELFDHKKYKQCIKILTKFINSKKGWIENVIDALYLLGECYFIIGENEKALSSLFNTFLYDVPRANICCKIANYFCLQKNFEVAIYWYNCASKCKDVTKKGGFVEPIYYNYYPYLQMCYCYFCLGDNKTAEKYNNLAKKYFKSEQVLNNEKYFNSLKNN